MSREIKPMASDPKWTWDHVLVCLLPWILLGLVLLYAGKVRESICPTCQGTGRVEGHRAGGGKAP